MRMIKQLVLTGLMTSGIADTAVAGGARQEISGPQITAVDLRDIDLRSDFGQAELKRRLKDNVRRSCMYFSNQARATPAGLGSGRVVSVPPAESPRSKCLRRGTEEARLYGEALIERATDRVGE